MLCVPTSQHPRVEVHLDCNRYRKVAGVVGSGSGSGSERRKDTRKYPSIAALQLIGPDIARVSAACEKDAKGGAQRGW